MSLRSFDDIAAEMHQRELHHFETEQRHEELKQRIREMAEQWESLAGANPNTAYQVCARDIRNVLDSGYFS